MTQHAQHRELVISKLARLLGRARAEEVARDALSVLGMDEIRSAEDRVAVGIELAHRSPGLAQVGTAIAAQAEMHSPHGTTAQSRAAFERAHAHAIIRASDHAIVGKTLDGTILSWNAGAQRLYGYSAFEARGQNIAMVVPQDKQAELADHLEQLAAGQRVPQLETVRIRKGGAKVEVALALSPLLGRDGSVIGASAMAHDISARLASNRERDAALAALAQKTAELERSNRELEQFAYVVSHDLQEPLRMVASYTALLKKRYAGRLDHKADRYIEHAIGGATRMRSMLAGLLALSRVGAVEAGFQSVALLDVVTEVRRIMAPQLAGATLRVGELPVVEGDGDELVRVFCNLFSNALKYRGDAAAAIDVRAQPRDGLWQISVADHGIGFDGDHASRMFQVFARLHAREEHEGSGIGLAIVAKVIERHGGTVWAEGVPGEGATIHFTLPGESTAQ